MAKERTPVPPDVSAEVLFLQDHTCCICREPGKAVQVHHIDDNPTNHSIENLAVLCLEDHERTQVRGGFGKKLLSAEVERYRGDWVKRVAERRARVDSLAASTMLQTAIVQNLEWSPPPIAQLVAYIDHLPALRKAAHDAAHRGWDTGVTAEMKGATSEVIDILEHVLNYLSAWYPPDHFGADGAKKYFNDYVASRYLWHRSLQDTQGPGSGGTIAGVMAGGGVMDDLSKAIEEMVEALGIGEVDLIRWRRRWRAAESRPSSSLREQLWSFFRWSG